MCVRACACVCDTHDFIQIKSEKWDFKPKVCRKRECPDRYPHTSVCFLHPVFLKSKQQRLECVDLSIMYTYKPKVTLLSAKKKKKKKK